MTSGKQSKRRRRMSAASRPSAPRRRASPWVLGVAAAVVVVVLSGVVLGGVLSGGDSANADVPARGSLVGALPGAADVEAMLEGIPQSGNLLGSPTAPVTIVEYVDLQCPYCRDFEVEALPTLIDRYIRTGKARLDLRLLAFLGEDSERGRAAAIGAGRQGKLFNFTHLLYRNQGGENTGWLDEDIVAAAAASVPGVDVQRLLDDSSSDAVADAERGFEARAATDHVTGTPTILVGKSGTAPRHVTLSSPTDARPVIRAIAASLGVAR